MVLLRYTKPAIVLHWLIAAGILGNIALAWTWPHLADGHVRPAIDVHKSIGITVLGLAILRLLWRFTHRPPPLPKTYRSWERVTSHVVHGALYFVMFAMPLSGWIMDSAYKDAATHPMAYFGLFAWPRISAILHLDPALKDHVHHLAGAAHAFGAYALYALVFLHVGGALKHEWIDREREIGRMWFGA